MLTFTDLAVRSLPRGYHWDAKLPSFGIRIGKNRKTWLVVKGANRTKVSLGHYPALSLQDARRKAMIALGTRHTPGTAPPFPEALEAFLAQPRWRPYSKYILEKSIRNHFHFTRPLDRITHEDIATVLDQIKAPSSRAHALKDIRAFFNWCVPRFIPSSPCVGLKMPPYKPRQRVLTDDELKRVWLAAEQMRDPFGRIVRLLILTGQRKSEIGTLRWHCLKDGTITLSETKNGREHTFPIGALTKSILPSPPVASGVTYVFHGSEGRPYNGWGKHLKELQKNSATSDWTLHDLRRTFASGMAALGIPIHVVEKLLNHVSGQLGGIAGVYNRYNYWDEQIAAITAWENKIRSLARAG